MVDVNLLAFNYAYGQFTNGPGISCWNFTKFCKNNFKIFTKLKSDIQTNDISKYSTNGSQYLHWWSGMTHDFLNIALKEKSLGKKIILGPNLLDGTNPKLEIEICNKLQPDLILVVNKDIKYTIKKYLNYRIEEFMTGPDYDLWKPNDDLIDAALWKGNRSHESKDISTALELKKKLVDRLHLMGYPSIYSYPSHIQQACRYKVYVCTSLSETKSEAVLEQLAAGCPGITHPKVFMTGVHYKTGIIVNKDLSEMYNAARKILDDSELRMDLSLGARDFILSNFKKQDLSDYYGWLLNEC